MDDKEVGELWKAIHKPQTGLMDDDRALMIELIRKLVEERANRVGAASALRQFDVDPDTWTWTED